MTVQIIRPFTLHEQLALEERIEIADLITDAMYGPSILMNPVVPVTNYLVQNTVVPSVMPYYTAIPTYYGAQTLIY